MCTGTFRVLRSTCCCFKWTLWMLVMRTQELTETKTQRERETILDDDTRRSLALALNLHKRLLELPHSFSGPHLTESHIWIRLDRVKLHQRIRIVRVSLQIFSGIMRHAILVGYEYSWLKISSWSTNARHCIHRWDGNSEVTTRYILQLA